MLKLSPEHLDMLRAFEERMVLEHPSIRGKEPTYFARSHNDDVYVHPEARLAFIGFVVGTKYAADAVQTALRAQQSQR
jgi:hypothetical protein